MSSVVEAELPGVLGPGPRVLGDRIQRCPGQIQAGGTTFAVKHFRLETGQDSQILRITLEPAEGIGDLVERAFTVVPVGRVADIVGQPGQVDQVRVAAQPDGHTPPDLGDFQGVRQPGARGVAVPGTDHLGLVGEPAQRSASAGHGRGPWRRRCGARCPSA